MAICSWKRANHSHHSFVKQGDGSKLLTVALFSRLERFAHSHSFVKSDENKSLPSLLTKEQRSKELREQLALGHKKVKTVKNIRKNMNLFELICRFWEQLPRITSESLMSLCFKDGAKSNGSDSQLGIKKGKTVKHIRINMNQVAHDKRVTGVMHSFSWVKCFFTISLTKTSESLENWMRTMSEFPTLVGGNLLSWMNSTSDYQDSKDKRGF